MKHLLLLCLIIFSNLTILKSQNLFETIGNDSLRLLKNGYIVGPNNIDCGNNVHTKSKWVNVNGVGYLTVVTLQHRNYDKSVIYDQNDNLIWSWNGESSNDTWYFRRHVVSVKGNSKVRIEFTQGFSDPFCNGKLQVVGISKNYPSGGTESSVSKSVSQKNSTSNNDVVISQCNYKLSIPVIKWQFKDNRKLCKYCRAKYSICTKANLEESKAINTVKLIQIRMDKHFRSINADDVHIDYDQARLMKFMKNNNYGGVLSGVNMLMGSIVDKLATAFGVDPEIGINEIELYNIKSEFCSLKCQDDYRRYR